MVSTRCTGTPAVRSATSGSGTFSHGFTYSGSKLLDPKGNPVALEVHVIGGWSDWVASLQIITKNLQAIGVDASVKIEPDWNSWYPSASSTKAPTLPCAPPSASSRKAAPIW